MCRNDTSLGKSETGIFQKNVVIPVLILSAVFEMCLMLGIYLDDRTKARSYYLILGIATFFLIGAVLTLFFACADRAKRRLDTESGEQEIKKRRRWLLFLLLIAAWSPYVVLCYPGNICWDSGTSILYFLNISRTNINNPPFQTVLFGIVYELGRKIGNVDSAIFGYCILQMVLFAAVLSGGIELMIRGRVNRGIIIFSAVLICFCPVFPLYALTMGKDSNFAVVMLLFELLLFRITREDKVPLQIHVQILFFVVSALAGLLRNGTDLIILLTLAALLPLKRKKVSGIVIVAVMVTVVVVDIGVPKILGAPSASKGEALSVPFQQTAYFMKYYGNEASSAEKKAIESVLPGADFSAYNPDIADPIKQYYNPNAGAKELRMYFRAWSSQFCKEPAAYLKAFVLGTYAYYSPTVEKSNIKQHAIIGYWIDPILYESTEIREPKSSRYAVAEKIDRTVTDLPGIGLLSRIGIYAWVIFAAVVYLITRKRPRDLICLLPLLMLWGMCILSPVNGYYRYAFNFILSVPIMIPLLLFRNAKIYK